MKEKNKIIIERIKIEMERTKLYVYIVIALTAGEYALFINIDKYFINEILFNIGFVLLIGFIFAFIHSYFRIGNLFKQLKNGTNNNS